MNCWRREAGPGLAITHCHNGRRDHFTSLVPLQGYEIAPDGTITKFIRIGIETFASKKRTTSGATSQFFYHNDHLGGVNVITDGSGARCQLNEYDPWGGDSRSEGPTPGTPATCDPTHRFTGQELDPESGLYYYGGRYYDQEISRFISPDPYIQDPDDPQNLNRYTYVLNNPQGYIDPTGFGFWDDLFDFFFGSFSSDSEEGDTSTSSSGGVGGIIGALITLFSSLDSEVVNKAELRREALKHKPNIFNQLALTSHTQLTNPNTQTNRGNDYPDDKGSWWQRATLAAKRWSDFTRVRKPDNEGNLTLGEAKWHWQHGKGAPVTVDVSTLDFSGFHVKDFPHGTGSSALFTFQNWRDFIVHGTVTTQLNADNTVSVLTDVFNFDLKPWRGNFLRNIYTIGLRIYVGPGTPYPIYFEGSVPIPP